jgi:hypothetical protein
MLKIRKKEEHLATRFPWCFVRATFGATETVGEFSTNYLLYDALAKQSSCGPVRRSNGSGSRSHRFGEQSTQFIPAFVQFIAFLLPEKVSLL